ncbi:hypothetical protein LOZ39_006729 [Ophidiomyces ophidiicola]|nr:hypothetical protein LOZ64_006613 [Ophidiomyces ophidiicola]KAI1910868.1 hypothetical protein LOZ61_004211 [Ophidiomyces ophidiicola]KAI1920608.1 hypothetical protein LOZ60_006510 [Ophidiomyces ophidiicola]KAI1946688.1 hypothetical protein LOZ59_006773 [Ophidiomyces ophidiicola]KAI2008605.1 hypothetical protein LOZ46_006597 [Ophidiomyces ophidiicola]
MAPYREQRRDKARAAANIGVKKRRLAIAAKDDLRSAREAPRVTDAVKVEEEWEEEDCRERLSYKRRGLRSGWAQKSYIIDDAVEPKYFIPRAPD